MATRPRVIIVGGGIVGAATAFFMTRAGWDALVIEAEVPAIAASGASDGAISVASKRPGLMMSIAQEARQLYAELSDGADAPLHGLFHRRPTFLIARDEEEVELLSAQQRSLQECGERVTPLPAKELRRRVPSIAASVLGGVAVEDDGHAIGYEITLRLLMLSGAEVRRKAPVRALVRTAGGRSAVQLDGELLEADAVVLAAGLGSATLLDIGDWLIPRKGHLIVTDRATGPALPGALMTAAYLKVKHAGSAGPNIGLVVDPLRTGQFLIGGSREEGRPDKETNVDIVAAILREALAVYPRLAERRVIRTFAGVRTATRDGLPVVGRHPAYDNLFIATGFEGDGICLGPLMGAKVAALVRGEALPASFAALTPDRISLRTAAA